MTYKGWIFMYEDEYNYLLSLDYIKMEGNNIGETIALGRCFNAYKAIAPTGEEFYYFSAREMARQLGFNRNHTRECLKGTRSDIDGWKFEYVEFEKAQKLPNRIPRKIKGLSPNSIEFIFDNISKFAEDHDLIATAISHCCRGKSRRHYDWTFSYIN